MDDSLDDVCDRVLGGRQEASLDDFVETEATIEHDFMTLTDPTHRRQQQQVPLVDLDVVDSCASVLADLSRVQDKMTMMQRSSRFTSSSSANGKTDAGNRPSIFLSTDSCRGVDAPSSRTRRKESDLFPGKRAPEGEAGLEDFSIKGSNSTAATTAVDWTSAKELLQFSVQYNPQIREMASRERRLAQMAKQQQVAAAPQAVVNEPVAQLQPESQGGKDKGPADEDDGSVKKLLSEELAKQRHLLEGIAKQQQEQHHIQRVLQQKISDEERNARRHEQQHQQVTRQAAKPTPLVNGGTTRSGQDQKSAAAAAAAAASAERPTVVAPVLSLESYDLQQRRDAAAVEKALAKERSLMDAERKAWQAMLKAQSDEHKARLEAEKRSSQQSVAEQRVAMHATAKQVFENMTLQQRMTKEAQEFQVEQQKRQMTAIRELLRPATSSMSRGGHPQAAEGSSPYARRVPKPSQTLDKSPSSKKHRPPPINNNISESLSPYHKSDGKQHHARTTDSATATSPITKRSTDAVIQAAPEEAAQHQDDPALPTQRNFDSVEQSVLGFAHEMHLGRKNNNNNDELLRPVLVMSEAIKEGNAAAYPTDDADCNFCVEMCVATFASVGGGNLSKEDSSGKRRKVLDKLTQEEAAMLRDARRRLERIRTFSLTQPRECDDDDWDSRNGVIHSVIGEAAEQLLFSTLSAGLVHEVIAEEVRRNITSTAAHHQHQQGAEAPAAAVAGLFPPRLSLSPAPDVDAVALGLIEECLLEHANIHPQVIRTQKPHTTADRRKEVAASAQAAVVDEVLKLLLAPPFGSGIAAQSAAADEQNKPAAALAEPIPHETVRAAGTTGDIQGMLLDNNHATSAVPSATGALQSGGCEIAVSKGNEAGFLQMQNCTIRVVLDLANFPSLPPAILPAAAVPAAVPIVAEQQDRRATCTIETQTIPEPDPNPGKNYSSFTPATEDEIVRRVTALVLDQQARQENKVPAAAAPAIAVQQPHQPESTKLGVPAASSMDDDSVLSQRRIQQVADAEFHSRRQVESEAQQLFAMAHEAFVYARNVLEQVQQPRKNNTNAIVKASSKQDAPSPLEAKTAPSVAKDSPAPAVAVTSHEAKPAAQAPVGPPPAPPLPPADEPEPIRDRVTSFIVEWFKVLEDSERQKRDTDYERINKSLQDMVVHAAAAKVENATDKKKLTREEVLRRTMDEGRESTLDYSTTHTSSYMPDGRHRFAEPHVRRQRRTLDTTNTTETTVYFNDSRDSTSYNRSSATTTTDSTRTSSGTSTTVSSMDSSELDLVIKQHMLQWPGSSGVGQEAPRQAAAATDVRPS